MARIFDVIEYPNEMKDEIVHRFPETGIGDYRIGSQVIVRESQSAVFFRDGNALDVFGPGRHTIAGGALRARRRISVRGSRSLQGLSRESAARGTAHS